MILDIFPVERVDPAQLHFKADQTCESSVVLKFSTGGKKLPIQGLIIERTLDNVCNSYQSNDTNDQPGPFAYIKAMTYKHMLKSLKENAVSSTTRDLDKTLDAITNTFRQNTDSTEVAHLDAILDQAFNLQI